MSEMADAETAAAESALRGLPADQRLAVEARVVDERPYSEIAAEMRCLSSWCASGSAAA